MGPPGFPVNALRFRCSDVVAPEVEEEFREAEFLVIGRPLHKVLAPEVTEELDARRRL